MIVVIGAGVSGLAAKRVLQALGRPSVLLEKCPTAGGLTRTIEVDDFCFDYTGHFLHLSRYDTPEDIPYANLRNVDWQLIDRKSYCFVDGEFISAPIQYNLGELKSDMLKAIIKSYENRPPLGEVADVSFQDFIVSGFGQYLADLFLIPQNEKTMATKLDRLSINAGKRFFPLPDEDLVWAGIRGEKNSTQYNSRFWYPKSGGIKLLAEGLGAGIEDLHTNQQVIAIDTNRSTITTLKGDTFHYDQIISSMPLRSLCMLCDERQLAESAAQLTYSSTICFNLGIRGPIAPALKDVHWLYVPDPSILFYRLGWYSNISSGMTAVECNSIYVEIGVPPTQLKILNCSTDLQSKVIDTLEKLEFFDRNSITCSVMHAIECAYIHHTPERERVIDKILSRLRELQIHPIGRYGLWDYMCIEDSIHSGISTAREIS